MTIRTVLNPYGGIPPIVDARIGTAYAVVEICVLNLETITEVANSNEQIQLVSTNMNSIVVNANNMASINLVAERFQDELTSRGQGTAGAIGVAVTIPWPTGVTLGKLRASNVCIKGNDNWLYHPSSTLFVAIGKPAGLEVILQPGAAALVGGVILWHITHTP